MNLIQKVRAVWSDFRLTRHRLDDVRAQQERLLARLDELQASTHTSIQESARVASGELAALGLRLAAEDPSRSIALLAEQVAESTVVVPGESPLVSIVLPTWNRGSMIGRALESIRAQSYPHWECLIVDDGSKDGTQEQIAGYLRDSRFRLVTQEHRGVCAARNRGLDESRGEIIAYLDSDNRWFSTYLGQVVAAYVDDPGLGCAYAMQVVENRGRVFIRGDDFDYDRLWDANFIDMSVISHRRVVFETLGGFDEALTSLTDWELMLRYARESRIRRLPVVGGLYREDARDRISGGALEHGYNWFYVREKHRRPSSVRPRVLYALWHYPHVTETYVRAEIRAALAAGVEIEVWSRQEAGVAYTSEVPVHRGTLREAVAAFRPAVIHAHWLNIAEEVLADPGCAGIPLTVRGHGFEFTPDRVRMLCGSDDVAAVFLFPHHAAMRTSQGAIGGDKVRAVAVAFDPTLHRPSGEKDRRLVLRVGPGLRTKDYETFFLAARACPEHHFVLVVCHSHTVESFTEEIIELNARLGAPAEIVVDLQNEDAARWMARAGVYLHTAHLTGEHAAPLGMPISIAEAMATGAHVLARDCAPLREYVGDAGGFYASAEEAAALVRRTAEWSDAEWAEARRRSVNRAFFNHASPEVVKPIIETWERLARGSASAAIAEGAEREVTLARPPQEAPHLLARPEVRSTV